VLRDAMLFLMPHTIRCCVMQHASTVSRCTKFHAKTYYLNFFFYLTFKSPAFQAQQKKWKKKENH